MVRTCILSLPQSLVINIVWLVKEEKGYPTLSPVPTGAW